MDHSKITPKLRLVVQSSVDSFSSEEEEEEEEKEEEENRNVVGTCIHMFTKGKKKDQKCNNNLPADPHPHGNDRYCTSCQSKDPVKGILENEILRECETHNCQYYALKQVNVTYGEDRFCKFCLANTEIQDKLFLEPNNEDMKSKHQEKGNPFTHDDLKRLHDSLGKPTFQTKKISDYLDANIRYVIESIICNHPPELANVLLHFSNSENNNWENTNSKILNGKLIFLKQDIVKKIVSQLNGIPFPSNKLKAKKDIIHQLCEMQCDLKREVIDVFEYEIANRRQKNNPLRRFIAEKICITGHKSDSLFTQTIFDAFVDWVKKRPEENLDNLVKSSNTFGKRLKQHVLQDNKKPLWKIGKYGPKTCHFGVKLKK